MSTIDGTKNTPSDFRSSMSFYIHTILVAVLTATKSTFLQKYEIIFFFYHARLEYICNLLDEISDDVFSVITCLICVIQSLNSASLSYTSGQFNWTHVFYPLC